MLCYVMLCYVMLCYVMLCYVMLCYEYSLFPEPLRDQLNTFDCPSKAAEKVLVSKISGANSSFLSLNVY
jgi:hypothetical protein